MYSILMSKAPTTSTIANSINNNKKYEVHIAAVPLRAPSGPPQLLMSAVYSLNLFDLQHYMVIINGGSTAESAEALVCDFQPEDPEDVFTAVLALSGRSIPGVVRTRKLKKLPKSKCWFVGYSEPLDDVEEALQEFNENWDANLRIGYHDCRNYVNELVEYFTGKKESFVLGEFKKMSHEQQYIV